MADRAIDKRDDPAFAVIVGWHRADRPDCSGWSFLFTARGYLCPVCRWEIDVAPSDEQPL